jgi:nicotinamide mononucleotide transporter
MFELPSALEVAANGTNAGSILLATANSRLTWPVGIVGCTLFLWLFALNQLYADALLQVFFIATSVIGWRAWQGNSTRAALPVQRTPAASLVPYVLLAALVGACYAAMLQAYTDAYAPWADSAVLVSSVLAQLLLMHRRLEAWPCWLLVNSIAVPLFWSRGLHMTSVLYACFWVNAVVGYLHWRRLVVPA